VNERNLGARDLDWVIFEKYCEKFEKESGGLNPKSSKKS
jgi:heat shock protein 4